MADRLILVCSPDLLARHPLQRHEDVAAAPRLTHLLWPWEIWFRRIRASPPPEPNGMVFDDSSLLLDAAVEGLGVALARSSLAELDLAGRRLVQPFPDSVELPAAFHIVSREDGPKLKRILRLRDWALTEASASRHAA